MGIDVYATWPGMTTAEERAQGAHTLCMDAGSAGYLREGYHGGPYATRFLCQDTTWRVKLVCGDGSRWH